MRKVLVDRELLDSAATWLEVHAPGGGCIEGSTAADLRAILAQPAEAEGVDFGFDDRSVRVSQEAYSIFLARERHHLAALSAVTAERDRLRALIAECAEYLNTDRETTIGSGSILHRQMIAAMAAKEA